MINLVDLNKQNKIFVSSVISHPSLSNNNFVQYNITHNFGKRPDYVGLYEVGSHHSWIDKRDYWQTNFPGFVLFSRGFTWATLDANTIQITVFNLDGARNIYCKVFLTGDPVVALT